MKTLWVLFIVLFTSAACLLCIGYVLKNANFEAPRYKIGPFHTPIATWCSEYGVEYLVTPADITLHVDPIGFPVNCPRAS